MERNIKNPWIRNSKPILGYITGRKEGKMNELEIYLERYKTTAEMLRAKGMPEEEILDALYERAESEEEGKNDSGNPKTRGKLRFYNSLTGRHEEMDW